MFEKRKTIQVADDTHATLEKLSKESKMKIGEIVGHVIDLTVKHDLLKPSWFEDLKDQIIEEMKSELSEDKFDRMLQLENRRATNKAKLMVWQEYLKIIPEGGKQAFLEEMLMINRGKGADFLDSLTLYSMVRINGEARPMRTDKDGNPIWQTPDEIVTCEKGYHVRRAYCKCPLWRVCKLRATEYEDFLIDDAKRRESTHLDKVRIQKGVT